MVDYAHNFIRDQDIGGTLVEIEAYHYVLFVIEAVQDEPEPVVSKITKAEGKYIPYILQILFCLISQNRRKCLQRQEEIQVRRLHICFSSILW